MIVCRKCSSLYKKGERCKPCRAAYSKRLPKDIILKRRLKYHFGITPEDYNKMFDEQAGKCAICTTHQSSLDKRLAVDHCHKTGTIRGLLCVKCNCALGLLKDNLTLLDRCKKYLVGDL